MNKIWGFIYIMNIGTPPKRGNPEEPSISMDYGSPPKRGRTTQVHKLNDIAQINALSYKSGFGFIFLMTDTNNVKKVLKVYFLDPHAGENTEGREFELPNNYIDVQAMNTSKNQAMNTSKNQAMNTSKNQAMNTSKKEKLPLFGDDNIGYPKRVESTFNFNKEVEIQKEVYLASSSNGPLCPQIYDSYIVDNQDSTFLKDNQDSTFLKDNQDSTFLKGLLKKCIKDKEAKNMIQYLIDNINGRYQRYNIGCILMEYTEGYTISSVVNSENVIYENVIYVNIRLLLETGYLHLDLNYGNVMVSGENVRLIDFGKSKKILDLLLKSDKDREFFNNNIHTIAIKDVLEAIDIFQLIESINYFDTKYGLNNINGGLFQQNFVSKLRNPETSYSYENIAVKLNARENKKIHSDLKNKATKPPSEKSSPSPLGKVLFGSPPQNTGKGLFDSLPENVFISSMVDSSPQKPGKGLFDSLPENVFISSMVDSSSPKTGKRLFVQTDDDNPNLSTPRKGGTTKRKHKNKSKKTRKNKSNKKRVKLISKK